MCVCPFPEWVFFKNWSNASDTKDVRGKQNCGNGYGLGSAESCEENMGVPIQLISYRNKLECLSLPVISTLVYYCNIYKQS
jgi:hypothetical protein